MIYYSEYLRKILGKNSRYKVINDPDLGMIFELKPIQAYRYVVLTGSGYLNIDEPELRTFAKKDVFRVFNQAQQYELQFGIFDDNDMEFAYDSSYFFNKYPFIMKGNKYILFIDYNENEECSEPPYFSELRKLNDLITKKGMNPNDFIVSLCDVDNTKDLESFFEYFVCDYFSKRGFITDSQIPFYYGVGTPDIAAYSVPELTSLLNEKFGISGCAAFELMNLRLLRDLESIGKNDGDEDYVFEVKTGSTNGSQIKKYINQDIFDKAYEMIPHKKHKSDYAGLFKFNPEGNLVIEEDAKLKTNNKKLFNKWLDIYLKMYLLHNFTKEGFAEFKKTNGINTNEDLIKILTKLSFKQLIDLFEEGDK